jgi:superfamily II DNA or RNA helicase
MPAPEDYMWKGAGGCALFGASTFERLLPKPGSIRMSTAELISIEEFDNFREVRDLSPFDVTDALISAVRSLDEREELEPYFLAILTDCNETAHGPAELVDIFTHKVTVKRKHGLAAFILKGKSFSKVRPQHVAHQIYRLEKMSGLKYVVFAATGTILDEAKEQFCSTAERIGARYAIFDAIDIARLLVAYGYLCPRDASRIVAGRCKCGYSPRKRILNLFQVESLKSLNEAHELGQKAGVVVLPPGSGKTRIAAEDAAHQGAQHTLYVAHTHEILDVAQSEFEAVFGCDNVTRHSERASFGTASRVNITTIQLVSLRMNELSLEAFDYVIIDEFHHAAAPTYRALIEAVDPDFLLGLTATPFRSDRQDIFELCGQNVVIQFGLRSGIEKGILCPYHYYGCFDNINYSMIRHNGVSYDARDLERSLIIPKRDEAIIKKWLSLAEGKPTIAFCCSHRHAERVAQSFNTWDIPAAVYISNTSLEERIQLIDQLQDGDLKVLCVVDVLNEGADLPFVECLLFLRPTESKRVFYQQLGRGLRKYVGKRHCVVIDFIGNFRNAYRIVEYQGLLDSYEEETVASFLGLRSSKDVLNLPLGCVVEFDDRVIDIFAEQTHSARFATRHNIGRILTYQYVKLARRLGRLPTRRDVDRYSLLHSELYDLAFNGWKNFMSSVVKDDNILPFIEPKQKKGAI